MKKIISTFISASLKIKCIIAISTVIVLTTGITVTAHFLGEQNNTKIAIDNEQEAIIEDFDIIENSEEVIEEEETQEEEIQEENKEEEEKNTGWNDGDFMYPGSGMESVRRKKGVFFTNHCR